MIVRVAVSLFLFAASCLASVIDSGAVLNNYSSGVSDSPWTVQMGSSGGNYSVQFTTDGFTSLNCACDPFLPPSGASATLSGAMVADFGASGSATVNGVNSPSVGFKGATGSGMFFQTTIDLLSASFTTGPGSFSLPFTMTGTLQARAASQSNLLLNDPITGSGVLTFGLRLSDGPGSSLVFMTNPATGFQLDWAFTPEPAAWIPAAAGLAVLAAGRRRLRGMIGGTR